ncbi:BlaI/MecI/CopY family transcriptional regulator, partial [Clostridioides difficile]|nr:BlaI/MecI/CopY family transcriptional regulator [Clostridioides difficile]
MIEKIPRAELKVMMLFWDTDKVLTSRYIVNIMIEEWNQTTTLTLLSRLSKRGLLESLDNSVSVVVCFHSSLIIFTISLVVNTLLVSPHTIITLSSS